MRKRILYFMPDNPVGGKAGNLTRSEKILHYLNDKYRNEADIEFLTIADWGEWDEKGISNFKRIFPSIILTFINRKISKKHPLKRIFLYKIPNFFFKLFKGASVDATNFYIKRKAKNKLNSNKYDIIIMSYSSWASLAFSIAHKPYLIIDTHDFLTAQNLNKKNKFGKLFQSEIDILRKFDEIWTLSIEEKFIYEQFTDSKVVYHPVTFNPKDYCDSSNFAYDIIYVASRNPHNVKSIRWFIENVLPHLKDYRVHIVGAICKEIEESHTNIVKHGIVENLDDYYDNAKVAICPMLSGTGVKIKVIEALAKNIPVVTTTRGVDGLQNKINNGCLVTDDPLYFAELIINLIENENFYKKIKSEAFNYFKNSHNPNLEDKLFSSVEHILKMK